MNTCIPISVEYMTFSDKFDLFSCDYIVAQNSTVY